MVQKIISSHFLDIKECVVCLQKSIISNTVEKRTSRRIKENFVASCNWKQLKDHGGTLLDLWREKKAELRNKEDALFPLSYRNCRTILNNKTRYWTDPQSIVACWSIPSLHGSILVFCLLCKHDPLLPFSSLFSRRSIISLAQAQVLRLAYVNKLSNHLYSLPSNASESKTLLCELVFVGFQH